MAAMARCLQKGVVMPPSKEALKLASLALQQYEDYLETRNLLAKAGYRFDLIVRRENTTTGETVAPYTIKRMELVEVVEVVAPVPIRDPNDGRGLVLDTSNLELAQLEHGSTIWAHRAADCSALGASIVPQRCPIHARSEHHMRAWPQNWRDDRGVMERICPHGVGHPDPDCRNHAQDLTHGCDDCCSQRS